MRSKHTACTCLLLQSRISFHRGECQQRKLGSSPCQLRKISLRYIPIWQNGPMWTTQSGRTTETLRSLSDEPCAESMSDNNDATLTCAEARWAPSALLSAPLRMNS